MQVACSKHDNLQCGWSRVFSKDRWLLIEKYKEKTIIFHTQSKNGAKLNINIFSKPRF